MTWGVRFRHSFRSIQLFHHKMDGLEIARLTATTSLELAGICDGVKSTPPQLTPSKGKLITNGDPRGPKSLSSRAPRPASARPQESRPTDKLAARRHPRGTPSRFGRVCNGPRQSLRIVANIDKSQNHEVETARR